MLDYHHGPPAHSQPKGNQPNARPAYHNRKQRKRNRRQRAEAEATAGPNIVERWGWGEPAHEIFGDLQLIRQAVREAWDVPEANRPAIVEAIMHLLDSRHDRTVQEGLADRLSISACRVFLDMETVNILREPCPPTHSERCAAKHRRLVLKGKSKAWNAWR